VEKRYGLHNDLLGRRGIQLREACENAGVESCDGSAQGGKKFDLSFFHFEEKEGEMLAHQHDALQKGWGGVDEKRKKRERLLKFILGKRENGWSSQFNPRTRGNDVL